ncbi:MAG: hypothetical protein AB7P12_19855 [Alphaproteobacteria bacterium]
MSALGIDIGGVIVVRVNDGSELSFFGDRYLENPPISGAFEGIRELGQERFGENVHLVSRCREETRRRTLAWFDHHGFWEATGLTRDRVHFCDERREKELVCARVGIDHFIDDHMDVLRQLPSVPNRFLFRPEQQDLVEFASLLDTVTIAQDWPSLVEAILRLGPVATG